MRLFEFITPNPGEIIPLENAKDPDKWNLLTKFIYENCNRVLYDMGKARKYLYRGVDISYDAFLGTSRNDRPASAALGNVDYQTIIDKKLKEAGIKARRSNSIFCADYETAMHYGPVFIIFPINGFDFTWSPQIEDLVLDLSLDDMNDNNFVQKYGFSDIHFDRALMSESEILIHGSYVALKFKKFYNLVKRDFRFEKL